MEFQKRNSLDQFHGVATPSTSTNVLALAEDLNIQRIHVASDCKTVINDIKQKNPASYGAILHEIID